MTQGISDNDRWAVRAIVSTIAVAASVLFLPFLLIFKLLEGFYVAARICKDCVEQAWRRPEK